MQFTRILNKQAVGLLTYRCHLKKPLQKINVNNGPISCRICGKVNETTFHIL